MLSVLFYWSYCLRVGFAAHYFSWRFMQHFLGLFGVLVFFIMIFYLPETYHPNKRGVDNLDPSLLPKWRPVILNPLRPLWLLRSPNLLFVVSVFFFLLFQELEVFVWNQSLAGFTILLTNYSMVAGFCCGLQRSCLL